MSADTTIIEHAMIVILIANPSDTESIKRAQDKWLDALIERAAEDVRLRQNPEYDGRPTW